MENLFDSIPNKRTGIEKKDTKDITKKDDIKKQINFLIPILEKLSNDEKIVINFAIIQELREDLYSKGYNIIVNGNESIVSIRDPKEDMIDEWSTFDCGN